MKARSLQQVMKKLPFSYRLKSQTVTSLEPYVPRDCVTFVTLLPFITIEIINK